MIQKNSEIHIRVSEKDKKALLRSAKRAGLSLSAYLRISGLQQQIYAKPSEALHDCICTVSDLNQTFWQSTDRSIEQRLNYLNARLLDVYHEQEANSGRDDQDLGDLKTAFPACWTMRPILKRRFTPIYRRCFITPGKAQRPTVMKKHALLPA